MRPRDLLLVAVINLVWAGNVIALKWAVSALPPITAAALRYLIVLILMLPWLRRVPGHMGALLGVALAQGAIWIVLLNLSFAGARNVAPLSFVGQLGAPISLILAVIFLGERIRLARTLALGAALIGVAVIGFDPALANEAVPLLLSVAAALSYSIGAILVRRMGGVHPFTVFAWLGALAAPILMIGSLVFEPGALAAVPHTSIRGLGAIGYSALLSSLVGHAGATYLYGRYPVSIVAPLLVPFPVIAAALAVRIFGDPVTPRLIVGGVLVTVAVAVITLRTGQTPEPAAT